MTTSSLTEVRDNLSDILDRVASTGEEWIVTRHGRNVAVILSFEEYEALIETVNILSDENAMDAIAEGLNDLDEDRGASHG
jgi:antitoxin YefM